MRELCLILYIFYCLVELLVSLMGEPELKFLCPLSLRKRKRKWCLIGEFSRILKLFVPYFVHAYRLFLYLKYVVK